MCKNDDPEILHFCSYSRPSSETKFRLQVDGFVVKQNKEVVEILTGFEQENTYDIFNKDRQQVGITSQKNILFDFRFTLQKSNQMDSPVSFWNIAEAWLWQSEILKKKVYKYSQ